MTGDLLSVGEGLAYPSVLLLWSAVLLRAAPALRSPYQRDLWLAVASATAAMTLTLPPLTDRITALGGPAHLVSLAANLCGVLSAGAVLSFVAASVGARWLSAVCWPATAIALGLLCLLDLLAPPHQEHQLPPMGPATPSLAYWLTLMAPHLVANTVCTGMCWRYACRAQDRSLSVSLRLFGLSTALCGLYWSGHLLRLTADVDASTPFLPLLMNLHGVFRAVAILVPTWFPVRRALDDIVTAWRLWPLWRDLVDSLPQVVLVRRRSMLAETLWPLFPRKLLVYRKVIEMRDAILILSNHAAPGLSRRARLHVAAAGVTDSRAGAAVVACIMRQLRGAELTEQPPQRDDAIPLVPDHGGLQGETRFLLDVARAYKSPAARTFTGGAADRT